MKNIGKHIPSQLSYAINRDYPHFVEFLSAYFEWMSQKGHVYDSLETFMDDTDIFSENVDKFSRALRNEYMPMIPESALKGKAEFIRWSREFNAVRGSKKSFDLLFRFLFDETMTSIYLPKDNVFRLSDGTWIEDTHLMYITRFTDVDPEHCYVSQTYKDSQGVTCFARGLVQSSINFDVNYYKAKLLTLTNIEGRFVLDQPVVIHALKGDVKESIYPTISGAKKVIDSGGNRIYDTIKFEGFNDYDIHRSVSSGTCDLKISSRLVSNQIKVKTPDGLTITDFRFDGRYLSGLDTSIKEVIVTLPSTGYYIFIDDVDDKGYVFHHTVKQAPIGFPRNTRSIGSNAVYEVAPSATCLLGGHFQNNRGQLSSDMYLTDSFYYQDYSYVIKTQQDITAYAQVVNDMVHPSGFVMFGETYHNALFKSDTTFDIIEDSILESSVTTMAKNSLGMNYKFVAMFADKLSPDVYPKGFFENVDQGMLKGETGYRDYDYDLVVRSFVDDAYFGDFRSTSLKSLYWTDHYSDDGYVDEKMTVEERKKRDAEIPKGWMTRIRYTDFSIEVIENK